MKIAGHGLAVDLPAGWEGRISRRHEGGPVLHVATFPLHAQDADYGASATGRMRGDDIFAALLEFRDEERIRPGIGLFRDHGQPVPRPAEFSPNQLQVMRPGQLGWQRFFTAGGRTSCLFAVVQPGGVPITALVSALQGVLGTVERVPDSASAS